MLALYLDFILGIGYLIMAALYYKEEKYKWGIWYSIYSFICIFLIACYDKY